MSYKFYHSVIVRNKRQLDFISMRYMLQHSQP